MKTLEVFKIYLIDRVGLVNYKKMGLPGFSFKNLFCLLGGLREALPAVLA